MIDYGTDYEYAQTRLLNTLVMFGDRPMVVNSLNTYDGCVRLECPITGKEVTTHLKQLDLNVPKLGYTNTPDGLIRIIRKPMRNDWRQGLRPRNVVLFGMGGGGFSLIAQCIVGNLPSFKEAVATVKGLGHSVAWHRDWALRHGLEVEYKGKSVGNVVNDEVMLNDNFRHLIHLLEDSL